jgi:hypothetical protein
MQAARTGTRQDVGQFLNCRDGGAVAQGVRAASVGVRRGWCRGGSCEA